MRLTNKIAQRRVSRLVIPVAYVETQSRLPGNDVRRARFCFYRANRCHQSRSILGMVLDCTDPLRGRGQRIATKIHRRRSRVVGVPRECELQPALAGNRFDHSQRQAGILQHRPLLNVELEVTENILAHRRLQNFFWMQTKLLNRLAYCNTLRVPTTQDVLAEIADKRPAANKRDAEANALLFREADNLDGKRKFMAVNGGEECKSNHNSENTVVSSGVWYGVQMRAHEQPWCSYCDCGIQNMEIPHSINSCHDSKRRRPGNKLPMTIAHRWR